MGRAHSTPENRPAWDNVAVRGLFKGTILIAACAALVVGIQGGGALGANKTVSVKDNFFSPGSVRIFKGQRVTWVWKGSNPHNVTGPSFHSATKTSGSYRKRFRRVGRVKVVCTIHPGMDMRVRVRRRN
jgi:plastocyanin